MTIDAVQQKESQLIEQPAHNRTETYIVLSSRLELETFSVLD